MTMRVLGKEMLKIEGGFDGAQEWEYRQKHNEEERDTLIIKSADKIQKDVDDIYFFRKSNKIYKTASAKLKGRNYELTFTNPTDKDAPKKMVVKIDKDKYYAREMKAKQKGVTMKITFTNIKIGVSDDVFKFDVMDYPNAVVVRE